ncbi:type I secretion system permease/ATPase [Acinetobacter sp.]|uniref:type I secretion system permease/ATPase n=1 Tax=Acinetobacter sp. TaxID=472 RepID=UPI0031E2007D
MITDHQFQSWLQALNIIASHYRIEVSHEQLLLQTQWNKYEHVDDFLHATVRQIGLKMRKADARLNQITAWQLPLILELNDGQIAVLDKIDQTGQMNLQFSGDQGLFQSFHVDELEHQVKQIYICRPESSIPDIRVDEYIKPYQQNWFWKIILHDWKRYIDIAVASLAANILALATIIFSMQVYDRVVPSQSIPTLWVLAGGVLIAAILEFILRISRVHLSDLLGKRSDLKISDYVFGHALHIKNSARSKSTGTFISQIRELENVRELITSTTIGAVADLPFFLLFLCIFWIIGGNLFWVILLIVPLMIIPAIIAQKKLAILSQQGMRESAIRNAILVEAVQGIEEIKLLRAEQRFQNQWHHMNQVSADVGMQQRKITGWLNAWTAKLQGLTYAIIVLVGCFAVIDGSMTTGALVACSILSSRMLAPISQITAVLGRWQQVKVAKKGLDDLMQKPVDHPERSNMIQKNNIRGDYQFSNVIFKYNEDDNQAILNIPNLHIKAGEKIAILGRNGAGKSSLLQLLSGMQTTTQGSITLDHIEMSLLDPDDIRRDMTLLNQGAHLFYGTIRENLKLGAPTATDQEIFHALKIANALDIVNQKKEGLDHLILEGGIGFSGGQRQALLLAQHILRDTNIVLFDEPSAALDDVSEKIIVEQLKKWSTHRTLVVATHRPAILQLVDRIIVLHEGRIIKDGPRDIILNTNKSNTSESQHGAA